MLKLFIVLHPWLGVALCVLFLLWFPSGIGMMYWGMPAVTTQGRLNRMPALDAATIKLSPEEAAFAYREIFEGAFRERVSAMAARVTLCYERTSNPNELKYRYVGS